MEQLIKQLEQALSGTITTSLAARNSVKHDRSLFEITPDAVATPTSVDDIKKIVKFVTKSKPTHPTLAITPRGAGTDMTGAAIGSSIVLEMLKLNKSDYFKGAIVRAQSGALLYDLGRMLSAHNLELGSSPSSRDYSTIGGMVANNSAGEHSYVYGNTAHWVRSLGVVLADGNRYTLKPLSKNELFKKISEPTYEGRLYAHLYGILNKNYDVIKNARPHTTKNSSGYNIWDVWNKEDGIFDITQLFTGSQGTLGIITDATIECVRSYKYSGSLLVQVKTPLQLDRALKCIKQHSPLSIEGFEGFTFMQGARSFSTLRKQLGTREYSKQQARLVPSIIKSGSKGAHTLLMVEFGAADEASLLSKLEKLFTELTAAKITSEISVENTSQTPVRRMRQSTAALLRNQIKSLYASPIIDDLAVHPSHVAEFLPKLRKLLRKHRIPAVIHGRYGDGNFRVLPLKKDGLKITPEKLEATLRDLTQLVISYGGTLSAEHGDGMIRGPWLQAQFGTEIYQIFKEVKELFDPLYIFNPHKKTDASWEYSTLHLKGR